MAEFVATEITKDFRVEIVDEPPKLPADVASEVEVLWSTMRRQLGGGLFEGQLFSALEVNKECIVGHFVPYKHFIAQLMDPDLFPELGVQSVAVTGITGINVRGVKSILLGQRSTTVTQHPGRYELAPSGGLDKDSVLDGVVDYRRQLIRELEEETAIAAWQVEDVQPFLLVNEPEHHSWELCLNITVDAEARDRVKANPSEYNRLLWVNAGALRQFAKSNNDMLVPLTRFLIDTQ